MATAPTATRPSRAGAGAAEAGAGASRRSHRPADWRSLASLAQSPTNSNGRGMTGRNLGRLAALTLAVLAAALGLAACGSSSGGGSDEDQIRTVVNHLADSDKAVCGELTDAYLKKIFKDKDRCEKQAEGSNEKAAFQITSVKVSADKAAAAVTTKKKEKGTI